MHLKRSEKKDIKQLLTWFNSLHDIQYWGGYNIRFPSSETLLEEDLLWDKNMSFSLYENKQLIGFSQVADKFECEHLCRIAISPDYRGKGIGKILVREIIKKRHHTGKDFTLFVMNDNAPAIRLYQSLNFIEEEAPDGFQMEQCMFMKKKNLTHS